MTTLIIAALFVLGVPAFGAALLVWRLLRIDDRYIQAGVLVLTLGCVVVLALDHVRSVRMQAALDSLKVGSKLSDVAFAVDGDVLRPLIDPSTGEPAEPRIIVRHVDWHDPIAGRLWSAEVEPRTGRIISVEQYLGSGVHMPSSFLLAGRAAAIAALLTALVWLARGARRSVRSDHGELAAEQRDAVDETGGRKA